MNHHVLCSVLSLNKTSVQNITLMKLQNAIRFKDAYIHIETKFLALPKLMQAMTTKFKFKGGKLQY